MRRNVILLLLAAILLPTLLRRVEAAERLDVDTIKAALHASEQENNGFIERVVERMEQGTLPRELVTKAFLWAKRKPSKRFQYFKWALITLARRQRIELS